MTKAVPSAERPKVLTIFAWLIILSSAVQIYTLLFAYDWYRSNYNYWPDWLFTLRYFFSWFQRILGLYIAVGLLTRRELARKLALVLGTFTILTLYWKHHYPAFVRHCQYLDSIYGQSLTSAAYPYQDFSFVRFAMPAMIIHCILDALFWGILMYVLTRPHIKQYFQSRSGS